MVAVTPLAAGNYPLAGITALMNKGELDGLGSQVKAQVDDIIGQLAKFGATPAEFTDRDACFFGFVRALSDGTVVTYQLDVDAAEAAMKARTWPVPVAYKEVARAGCAFNAASNSETCSDPNGGRFALVYFDAEHREFAYLQDPRDVPAARANPASLQRSRIIDCSASASFLEGHIMPGTIAMRVEARPLVLGYFLSRVANEPDFAKAAQAFFNARP